MDHNQASLLDYQVVANALETSASSGLSAAEARERLKKYGPNLVNEQAEPSSVRRLVRANVCQFLGQLMQPLVQLLLVCLLVSLAIGEYANSASIAAAILIVCAISFAQAQRAERSLERLNKQMPTTCRVLRADSPTPVELEAHRLVPGDVIHLAEGQRVPADVRLFEVRSLTVNEANLTGEPQSQLKTGQPMGRQITSALASGLSTQPTIAPATRDDNDHDHDDHDDDHYNDHYNDDNDHDNVEDPQQQQQQRPARCLFRNLALMGTLVESGNSKGIVVCTGKATRYGEVFSLLKATSQPKSPLQANIDQLSYHLVVASCLVVALGSIAGILQQRPALQVAHYALSLAVTAIPEGLPVVVAIIMSLGVVRLGQRRAIVKSLASIETLGCVQVLCADKTGTLTRNDMSLTDVVTSELHSLSSDDLEQLHALQEPADQVTTFNKLGGRLYSIGRLMEVGTLCNNATVELDSNNGAPTGRLLGQATECALLEAAIKLGFGDSRTKFKRLGEIPFSSSSRRMVVQCQRQDLASSSPMFYVKGAWEDILRDCNHYYECGLVKPRADEMWLEYARICTALGAQGLRVLALALGPAPDQLTFVGLVGIRNALREGIVETIGKLRDEFHLDVKLITGDSRATALAVGRSLGLVDGTSAEAADRVCMSGDQLQRLLSNQNVGQSADLKAHEILNKCVFYRVDPIQKANIVSKLQQLDKVVAMTGDGVNDLVGLKRANLSLAMGSGADVCKEIADVVVANDNLCVLLEAVVEGKGIYHKIHSFLAYQVSISAALVCLVGAAFAARLEPPYTTIQVLFINLLADGPPAHGLATERLSANELCLWPRNVHDPLLGWRLLATILALGSALLLLNGGLYFFLLANGGQVDARARSLLFACFVYSCLFAALGLRSKLKTSFETRLHANRGLLGCWLIVVALTLLVCQVRPLNGLLQTQWVAYPELLCVFLYASLVLIAMDSLKLLVRLLEYARKSMIKAAVHSSMA